jgi:MerR family mercuric resistance operon transcriptional regulator
MSEQSFNIGGLAKAAGMPTSTVRFYERQGLLRPDSRSRSNYRVYGQAALRRLRFIRAAHAAGFTLSDMARLLAEVDGEPETCAHVQNLITQRLAKVEATLSQLTHAREVLTRWQAACRRAARSGRCVVLEALETPPPPSLPGRSSARKEISRSP